ALDEVHSEGVEPPGDAQLVPERVRDPLTLRAITQRGVVNGYPTIGRPGARVDHGAISRSCPGWRSQLGRQPSLWAARPAWRARAKPSSGSGQRDTPWHWRLSRRCRRLG